MRKRKTLLREVSAKDAELEYSDLLGKNLSQVDPDIDLIIGFEEGRQKDKLILIPSESISPRAVRDALGSVFTNLYAEGYPPLRMTKDEEEMLLDFKHQLTYYRRYSDRRFYKGTEYVNFVEALAQRRAAECFATDKDPQNPVKISPDEIFVNVQPLSGAAANNAVYEAFVEPGETVMGMALPHGGHLTHGSQFNRSGKRYHIVSYEVSRETERLDYEAIERLAVQHRPRMIIAGYTSYPWAVDWQKFRKIADTVGAILLADIAHTAGMVIAGQYPSPVGCADVITFTTHKTICGPRGAVILTTDEDKAEKIDNAVFPGEQGGPHVNKFAAMAVAFKIAQTEKFRRLQERIVENAKVLASSLIRRGLRLAYGGGNTHLLVIDLSAVKTRTGFPLKGEIAARILDLCGLVVNKNTIPGDETAADASGIRLGTPWLTQRGLGKEDMEKLAELIHRVIVSIQPFSYIGLKGDLSRGKVDLKVIEEVRLEVAGLIQKAKSSPPARVPNIGYPHYHLSTELLVRNTPLFSQHKMLGASFTQTSGWRLPLGYQNFQEELEAAHSKAALFDLSDKGLLRVSGERAKPFLQGVSTNDLASLKPGGIFRSFLLDKDTRVIDDVSILHLNPDNTGRDHYLMVTNPQNTEKVKSWLRGLSDGYILFDSEDIFAKIEGPVVVEDLRETEDETSRKMVIALYGPNSSKILSKIDTSLANLSEFNFLEGKIRGIKGIISRMVYAKDYSGFELYIHPDDAPGLWDLLLKEGEAFGVRPAGIWARDRLRHEMGLPSHEEGKMRVDGVFLCKAAHKSLFCLSKCYFVGQKLINEAMGPSGRGKEEFRYQEEGGEEKKTPLYEEHLKLGAKFVSFAGYKMPLSYTSIGEEHRAVRETAGLFDVAHMGILEISGEHAASFLDAVTTNYIRWIKQGESQYAHILDPDGRILDDVMIYCRGGDRYMMVANAVNEKKIWTWLSAVNSGRYLIDRDYPEKEVEGKAHLRDLKDTSSGKDQKVDLALQGPNSLAILKKLTEEKEAKGKLARIRPGEFIETKLAGVEMLISRTGYTGEDVGYEIYLHPEDAPLIWKLLLKEGKEFGVRPAGLGARDSTRIEAGLPLYGHELAGRYDIGSMGAGYGLFVKLHKPYFIGKKRFLEREAERKMEIVRFKMKVRGVRAVKFGDPVVAAKGRYIGHVTSCALVEGIQLGLAYVDRSYVKEGTKIRIFVLPREGKVPPERAKDELILGDKVLLPEEALVLSRFLMPEILSANVERREEK